MSEESDKLKENAGRPKKMTINGETVEQHSIEEQIAADQYAQPPQKVRARYRQFRHRGVGF